MKGIIALDIDGTAAAPGKAVSWEVCQFLKQLVQDHWQIIFITGRTFHFGFQALHPLNFPYYLAVQNGAIIIEMPSQTIVGKKYLDASIIPTMEKICENHPSDFVIYGGFEYQDRCYYRAKNFSEPLLEYLENRVSTFKETWVDVPNFDNLDIDNFASVKCFGTQPSATQIADRIEKELGLHVPLIRDAFNMDYYVVQATHPEVSKGQAVRDIKAILNADGIVIAAGDDYNDVSMFSVANVKVVMETAPLDLQKGADVIAPSAEKNGLIAGLKAAIDLNKQNKN